MEGNQCWEEDRVVKELQPFTCSDLAAGINDLTQGTIGKGGEALGEASKDSTFDIFTKATSKLGVVVSKVRNACIKVTWMEDNKKKVKRGCDVVSDLVGEGTCIDTDKGQHQCFCEHDKCNGSAAITTSILAVALSLILAKIL
jgi:hypothetical protein